MSCTRSLILNQLKGNILEEDYNNYVANPASLIDFKYFLPFYTIHQHCMYLKYFLIDYCKEYDEWLLKYYNYFECQNLRNITPEFFLSIYGKIGNRLRYGYFMTIPIEKRTYELYKNILSKDGSFLKYISDFEQTYELCLIAVKNNKYAFKYIKNNNCQTPEIIKLFVENDYSSLRMIDEKNQTKELIEFVIKTNIKSIFYIKNKDLRDYFIKENIAEYLCAITELLIKQNIINI